MRNLLRIVTSDLEGIELAALDLFNSHGNHADNIIIPITDSLSVINIVLDVMRIHQIQTVDLETDNEEIFKTFLPIVGVNVSLVSSANFTEMYRLLSPESEEFPIIQDLYLTQIIEEKPLKAELTAWQRFLFWAKKLVIGRKNND